MKKSLIPLLAVLIAITGFGCGKKVESGAVDSAKPGVEKMAAPKAGANNLAKPTTQIMPPAESDPTGALTVTIPGGGNAVLFYVYFEVPATGAQPQQVTISYNGGTTTTYNSPAKSGPPGGLNFTPLPVFSSAGQENISVVDTIGGVAATLAASSPSKTTQVYGWDITTFSDASGNKATIVVMDLAGN